MGNYGIKVSRPGYDVKSCADYELLFSSGWPLLKIHSQGTFSVADTTLDVTIKTHSLGYVPMFWVFDTSAYVYPSSGESKMSSPGTSQYIGSNDTALKWLGNTRGVGAGTFSGRYYVFTLDLATAFTAPVVYVDTTTPESFGDYGLKASIEGEDVGSNDYRDFTVHSGTRSPLIHKVGTGSFGAGGGTATIAHNLGYEPMFFFYGLLTSFGDGYWQNLSTASDCVSEADTTNISLSSPYQMSYAYVVLKDPLLLD